MATRLHKNALRCERCGMRPVLCVCPHFPDCSDVRSRILLPVHRRELRTTTNTGKLAVHLLPGSALHLRGAREDRALAPPRLAELAEGRQALFLFPGEGSVELTRERAEAFTEGFSRGVLLVVPDGTWSQAARIRHREPAFSGLPCAHLPKGPPSQYRLRTNPNPERISTFEAVARALGILEGPERGPVLQAAWERFFEIRIEWALWARGLLRAENMRVPPPYDAVQEFFIAGAKGSSSE